jgi:hypothetical protein
MTYKGEEEGGEDENEEEGESRKHFWHSMTLQCVDNLLDYMGQTGFKYSALKLLGKFMLPQGEV